MIVTVTVDTDAGTRSYTGHIVCRGPGTMEMLLTEPFSAAGQCVQFPVARIIDEARHEQVLATSPVNGNTS